MVQVSREGLRHFRGKPRPGRRVELRYQIVDPHDVGPLLSAFTRNIGIGGAFIATPDPAPPGARLTVQLALPPAGGASGREVAIQAEVRWIADGDDERDHGMGVRFSGLSVDDTIVLNEYFSSLEVLDVDAG
jgi:hypothetical protein